MDGSPVKPFAYINYSKIENKSPALCLSAELLSKCIHLKNGIVYNITVTEDEGLSFVYRLVLDAKPDRGML